MNLFVSDLDGTLLNDKKEISKKNCLAIAEMVQQGFQIALATGRSMEAIDYLKKLKLSTAFMMPFNGSVIMEYPSQKMLLKKTVTKEVAQVLLLLAKKEEVPIIASEQFDSCIFIPDGVKEIDEVSTHFTVLSEEEFLYFTQIKSIFRIAFRFKTEKSLQNFFAKLSRLGLEPVISDHYCAEILPKNWGKGQATKWLANFLTINRQNILSIGDNGNDLEMLDYAGYSVAMSNAPQFVQSHADFVTKSNNDDGVAFAIQQYLENVSNVEKFY